MGRPSRYSPEVRERAVRMVLEHEREYESQWAAMAASVLTERPAVPGAMKYSLLCGTIGVSLEGDHRRDPGGWRDQSLRGVSSRVEKRHGSLAAVSFDSSSVTAGSTAVALNLRSCLVNR